MHLRYLNLNWLFLHRAVREAYRTENPSTSKPLWLSLSPLAWTWRMVYRTPYEFLYGKLKLMTKGSKSVGEEVGERCCKVLLKKPQTTQHSWEAAVIDRAHTHAATMRNMVHLRKSSNHSFIHSFVWDAGCIPGPALGIWDRTARRTAKVSALMEFIF